MNIRDIFLSLRRLMPPEEKQKADRIICDKVMAIQEWQKADTVCLYMSTTEEVDTKPLLAAALTEKKQVVFPRVEHERLVLHQIRSIKDFTRGAYHIFEPKKTTGIIDPKSIDLYIVPGVVFDRNGYRLGWGKGYYDKLLSGIDAPKVGFAYACQVIAELPHTSYDVPMTMVVTEKENI
jgi:5-formyltetrahydrofolate cyclo-ligase